MIVKSHSEEWSRSARPDASMLDHATLRAVDAALAAEGHTRQDSRSARGIVRSLNPTAFAPRRVPVVRALSARRRLRITQAHTVVWERLVGSVWVDDPHHVNDSEEISIAAEALRAAGPDGMEPEPAEPEPEGGCAGICDRIALGPQEGA